MASDRFEDLVETFAFLDDWEDRYRHVIEMGREMPELPEAQRVASTKVDGCASQVWLVPRIEGEGAGARIHFDGASDAMIVQGLIAVLKTLYDGQTATDALAVDAAAEFKRLGLDGHLSAQRSNGLRAMVGRVRAIAEAAKGAA